MVVLRPLLTTGSDLADLNSRDQITTSYMYNAGLGFTLGGNTSTPDVVRRSTLEDRLDAQQENFERRADSIRAANQLEIAELRERYQDSIASLDQELVDALDAGGHRNRPRKSVKSVPKPPPSSPELETRQDELRVRGLEADAQRDAREAC